MTRILNVLFKITLAAMPVAIGLCLYVSWVERTYPPEQVCQECPEPQPKIEDHVAAVIEMDRNCPACPDCPTHDALKRAGVEVICTNAFGEVPSVNYWQQDMPMACSRIKKVVIRDKRIEVERK